MRATAARSGTVSKSQTITYSSTFRSLPLWKIEAHSDSTFSGAASPQPM